MVTGIARNELRHTVSGLVGARRKCYISTEISHIRLKLVAYTTNNSLIINVADNGHGNSREFVYNGHDNYQAVHIMAMVIHANTGLLKP